MAEGKAFTLEVVTSQRVLFTGPVTTVVAPAADGYLGILAHHAPMLVTLTPGKIVFRNPEGAMTTLQNQGGGFLEVHQNTVTVLAETLAS